MGRDARRIRAGFSVALVIVFFGWMPESPASVDIAEEVRDRLKNRIESVSQAAEEPDPAKTSFRSPLLPRFYAQRMYRPAWSDERGVFPQADELVYHLSNAWMEGLRPEDYFLEKIWKMRPDPARGGGPDPERIASYDILLTDAFLVYATHLLSGRVPAEEIDPEWHARKRDIDPVKVVQSAVKSRRIGDALRRHIPSQPEYDRLKAARLRYIEIAGSGGWPKVSPGRFGAGDRAPGVLQLRSRLLASGDLSEASSNDPELFDATLERGVMAFQKRHGLKVDGIVGPNTVRAMNVPVAERIRRMEVNMERWRWLPPSLGKRHIRVNIADYRLQLIEHGRPLLDMRAIVGKPYRRTPVFSGRMTYLVFNPNWFVPWEIAEKDILPMVRKDIGYLSREGFRVYRGWGEEAREIDPRKIDWKRVRPGNKAYWFLQNPGPVNALGKVKFMFPNRYNIYIHDTPSRDLFARTGRGFSSGCIRIEKPVQLAEHLLSVLPEWNLERLLLVLESHNELTVDLPDPVPVHILYWTAWVEEDGTIHFRDDIYERDGLIAVTLTRNRPAF